MARASILHMMTSAPNLSPFDVNMAVDAGWQHCIPYTGLSVAQLPALTQDAIFSRGPKGVKATGIFIGGRDIHLAMDMLAQARGAMLPPFQVSVFADPSGAFTTAAGMVACAERHLREAGGGELQGKTALVFGGTGPVGMTCAMLAAGAGARAVIVSHQNLAAAGDAADACRERYDAALEPADGSDDARIRALLGDADLVFSAAPAGVAERLYEAYTAALVRALGAGRVATGRFGAGMQVELVNEGPVTIELNTDGKAADPR